MKSSILLTISVTSMSLLFVFSLVYAQTEQAAANPPVAQPLVREGTVAVKLAEALKLGNVSNEAEAEGMLDAVGIEPKNGWIADYPVTPDIVGELRAAVMTAADAKQLSMNRDEASKAFQEVMFTYDMAVRPAPEGQSAGNVPSSEPDQTIINNYYYDEGPPIVTYYAPPPDYAYLYTWVPYPFWWTDFWFPGYFVLVDFEVFAHHHGHFRHGRDFDRDRGFRHGRDGDHFSNHFRDPKTGAISRIDPVNRAHIGTFADRKASGWTSTSAQNGARGIYNSRVIGSSGTQWSRGTTSPFVSNPASRTGFVATSRTRTTDLKGWNREGMTPQVQSTPSRSFGNMRSYYSGRSFTAPNSSRTVGPYRSGSTFGGSMSSHVFQPRTGSSSSGGWHSSGGGMNSHSFSGGGWHSGGGGGGMRSSGGFTRR